MSLSLTPYVPIELIEGQTRTIKIQNVETKKKKVLQVARSFPISGQIPNSTFVKIAGVLE